MVDVYYRTMFFNDSNYSNRSTKYLILIPRKNNIRDFIIEHVGNIFNRNLSINSLFIFVRSIVSSSTGNTFIYILTPGMENNNRRPGIPVSENYVIPIIEKEIEKGSNLRVHAYSQGSNHILNPDTTINFMADNYNLKEIVFNAPLFNNYQNIQITNILETTPGPLKLADVIIIILNLYKSFFSRTAASQEDANKQVLLSSTLGSTFLFLYNSASLPIKYWKNTFIQLVGLYYSSEDFETELRRLLGIVTGEEPIESLKYDNLFYEDEFNEQEFKNIIKNYNNFNIFSRDYKFPNVNITIVHLFGDEIIPYVAVNESTGVPIAVSSNPPGSVNSFQFILKSRFNIVSKMINDDTLNDFQKEIFSRFKNNSVHSYITVLIALNYIIDSSE